MLVKLRERSNIASHQFLEDISVPPSMSVYEKRVLGVGFFDKLKTLKFYRSIRCCINFIVRKLFT